MLETQRLDPTEIMLFGMPHAPVGALGFLLLRHPQRPGPLAAGWYMEAPPPATEWTGGADQILVQHGL